MTTIHLIIATMFGISTFIILLTKATTRYYPVKDMREVLVLMVKYEPHYSHTDPLKFGWFLRAVNHYYVFTAVGASIAVAACAIQFCFLLGLGFENEVVFTGDYVVLLLVVSVIGGFLGWAAGEHLGQRPKLKMLQHIGLNKIGNMKPYSQEVSGAYRVNGKFKFTVAILEHFQWPYQVTGIVDGIEEKMPYRYLIEFKYADNRPGFVLIQSQAPLYGQFFTMLDDNSGFVHHELFQLIAEEILARTSTDNDITKVALGRRQQVSIEEINEVSTQENQKGYGFKNISYWPMHDKFKTDKEATIRKNRLEHLIATVTEKDILDAIEREGLLNLTWDDVKKIMVQAYHVSDSEGVGKFLQELGLTLAYISAEETRDEDYVALIHLATGVSLTTKLQFKQLEDITVKIDTDKYFNYLVDNLPSETMAVPAREAFKAFALVFQPIPYTAKENEWFRELIITHRLTARKLTRTNFNVYLTFRGISYDDYRDIVVEGFDEYNLLSTHMDTCEEYRAHRLSTLGTPAVLKVALIQQLRKHIATLTNSSEVCPKETFDRVRKDYLSRVKP